MEEAHEPFDRGTEAGRLIYNLYNNSASLRKNYKPNVKIRTKKSIDPEAEHKKKQRDNYEKVKAEKSHGAAAPKFKSKETGPTGPYIPTRKSQAVIEAENRVNFPKGPNKAAKLQYVETREQQIRKFQNKMSGTKSRRRSSVKKSKGVSGETEGNVDETRFDSLVGEIQEREEFLKEMMELGQADEYEGQIKGEIAQLVKEMEQLDAKLSRKK